MAESYSMGASMMILGALIMGLLAGKLLSTGKWDIKRAYEFGRRDEQRLLHDLMAHGDSVSWKAQREFLMKEALEEWEKRKSE